MTVFRLQKLKYGVDLSGKGSNKVSGRWNVKGDFLILYTSANKSLALLEKIESFSTDPGVKLPSFIMLEIEIPDSKVVYIEEMQLPKGWNNEIDKSPSQLFGMDWLSKYKSLAISVPSVFSLDRNILINPQHPEFNIVKIVNSIENFPINKRLRASLPYNKNL